MTNNTMEKDWKCGKCDGANIPEHFRACPMKDWGLREKAIRADERKRIVEMLPKFLFTSPDIQKEMKEGTRGYNQQIAWDRCLTEIINLLSNKGQTATID